MPEGDYIQSLENVDILQEMPESSSVPYAHSQSDLSVYLFLNYKTYLYLHIIVRAASATLIHSQIVINVCVAIWFTAGEESEGLSEWFSHYFNPNTEYRTAMMRKNLKAEPSHARLTFSPQLPSLNGTATEL